jgi:hypothetical protein
MGWFIGSIPVYIGLKIMEDASSDVNILGKLLP